MNDKKIEGQFPLFLHLKNEIDNDESSDNIESLTTQQATELAEQVKELNEQGCSLIYALIRYYQIYEMSINAVEIPFGMKKTKHGYRFCIEDLPALLQHLIYRFVHIHIRSQRESI